MDGVEIVDDDDEMRSRRQNGKRFARGQGAGDCTIVLLTGM